MRQPPTLRERFHGVMDYSPVGRLPNFEFGYWAETLPNWHRQGLPPEIDNEARAYAYFGIENWEGVPCNTGILPGFEPRVLEETGEHRIIIDGSGVKAVVMKDGGATIPHYLEFPVRDWDTWKEVKKNHLDPLAGGRLPEYWLQHARTAQEAGFPVAVPLGSLYGIPRNLMGFDGISYALYDNWELVDDIVETLCRIVEVCLDRILPRFPGDFGAGWEDICFNSGPIISPEMFRRLVVPRYQRITSRMRDHGIRMVWTDCDGDITPLVPAFLEGGVNCMFPIEVRAGSDPVRLRERFGRELLLVGGVDKMCFYKGAKEIEKELLRLLPVVRDGGYIPTVDHRVPSDVPFEAYKTYIRLKREIFETGGEPQCAL